MNALELEAARRLVKVMDEQLASLDVASDLAIPSEGQFSFYVSDNQGFIHIHQDAAFVVERVAVLGSFPSMQIETPTTGNAMQARLSIKDRGPGNTLTLGQQFVGTDIQDTERIPWALLTPLQSLPNFVSYPAMNMDWVYRVAAEWVVARGTVVQVASADVNTNPNGPFALTASLGEFGYWPRVILSGYKVYG